MSGALIFHPPTEEDPIPNKPRKDGHFDNIHDAATYGPAHEVTPVDKVQGEPAPRVEYVNRMRVEVPTTQRNIGWKETRHGW